MNHPKRTCTEIENDFLSKSSIKKVIKGSYLFQEGMAAKELYPVKSGKVQIGKVIPGWTGAKLQNLSSGDVIGELTLFCDESHPICSMPE